MFEVWSWVCVVVVLYQQFNRRSTGERSGGTSSSSQLCWVETPAHLELIGYRQEDIGSWKPVPLSLSVCFHGNRLSHL